jgi:hypothetical protein
MSRRIRPTILLGLLGLGCLIVSGCATLQQLVALDQVDFDLDGLSRVELAGVDLYDARSFADLTISDGLMLADAVRAGRLPLILGLRVQATNPESNVDARLVRLDWTLILDGRETVAGRVADELVLPSGEETTVPVTAELDLLEFFDGGAQELFELALAVSGAGDESKELTLRIMPTVDTVLGPISYAAPIRISLPAGGP